MLRVNLNAWEREQAYTARMEALGFEAEVIGAAVMEEGQYFEGHGEFGQGRLMDRSILRVNDRVAIGAIRAAARHGMVPGRNAKGGLRIAGHDDYPLCPFLNPALTTVAQNTDAIGKKAASRILQIIHEEVNDQAPEITLFDGHLKLRESA